MPKLTHSERFTEFLQALRDSGSAIPASDGQCAVLIADALDLLDPEHDDDGIADRLQTTCQGLAEDFRVIGEILGEY